MPWVSFSITPKAFANLAQGNTLGKSETLVSNPERVSVTNCAIAPFQGDVMIATFTQGATVG